MKIKLLMAVIVLGTFMFLESCKSENNFDKKELEGQLGSISASNVKLKIPLALLEGEHPLSDNFRNIIFRTTPEFKEKHKNLSLRDLVQKYEEYYSSRSDEKPFDIVIVE
ncbi:MAG: hypothetical protein MI748_12830 [Opitutales bacterium]|nr:hypothetical protein [Opitutales bacterium]